MLKWVPIHPFPFPSCKSLAAASLSLLLPTSDLVFDQERVDLLPLDDNKIIPVDTLHNQPTNQPLNNENVLHDDYYIPGTSVLAAVLILLLLCFSGISPEKA